jgi:hypothetical protein
VATIERSIAPLLPIMAVISIAFLVIVLAMPVLPLHVHHGLGLDRESVRSLMIFSALSHSANKLWPSLA